MTPARYNRIPALGWRDWVLDDVSPIRRYLQEHSTSLKDSTPPPINFLVDIVVPTFRIELPFLERLCSLVVPEYFRTTFIVVVDNPSKLLGVSGMLGSSTTDENQAALVLEQHLANASKSLSNGFRGNNVRVRCNAKNLGASASRNKGVDESSAEYVLFLDDDVIPEPDVLEAYGTALKTQVLDSKYELVGLVGLVRFPRSSSLPLRHAAVLMSYLTFMFEIADNPHYTRPAWGVTANILVKRTGIRFDTAYAKTGGGEDVDFCLRLTETGAGELRACPSAVVYHPFWPGSSWTLSRHFFNWARGDSALFARFPEHCYYSWPNAVECMLFLVPMLIACKVGTGFILTMSLLFLAADVGVEMSDLSNFRHRCALLHFERPLWFYVAAHVLANIYVFVLESGRLWGHLKRLELQNLTRRFDWHCGRLENSSQSFIRREFHKFVLFSSIALTFIATIYT